MGLFIELEEVPDQGLPGELRPVKSLEHSVIQIGAWRVDAALDEISREGQTTKLEPKMMQLLLCLAAQAGRVVSVEQLLDEVWKDVVVTADSVYHAVAALRRVLGDDSKDPSYIANVLRRGYRLIAPVVRLDQAEASAPPRKSTQSATENQAVKLAVELPQPKSLRRLAGRRLDIAIAQGADLPRGERTSGKHGEIWIGLDTGGTFTDAVALDAERRVIASAKALTTHWDLAVGLGEAIHAVLGKLPGGAKREHISLVSVSTTLATNAVVESRFSPICTLLVGFNEQMLERSGLRRAGGVLVRVRGGHEATGEESEPLEEAAIDAAVREFAPQVEAFAVAAMFSVRNPAHERRARDRIRALCDKSVTCSYELSSQLDAPKRALTAALNARLTPQIRHLLEALGEVLEREAVSAPVMVVRGDGTLIRAEVALEYPVETILSGPAASVVGAGFLSGLADFAVADMGGTTTDVAIVSAGQPLVRSEGAVLGGWRTMVKAIDVHTCGLGGDSEVYFDRDMRLRVGPRRAMPLSLLATQFPQVLDDLHKLAASKHLPPFAARFALRNPGRDPEAQLDRLERRVWDGLGASPRPLGEVARTAVAAEAVRRLVDRGLATLATFTPSDALHVLGRQRDWNAEAARLGGTVLAIEERNARARAQAETPEVFAERIYQYVMREATRVVLQCALAHDPGIEASPGRWGPLERLIEDVAAGRRFSAVLDATMRLTMPLVAIGAPAGAYYPEVAQRLGAQHLVPEHAAVCNAVGAVAGVVSETCEVLVNQPALKLFRVHDPAGNRDYTDANEAIEEARRVSRDLALAAALRAGASDPHVETSVTERRAHAGSNSELDFLAEAVVRSRATGRPAAGRAA